MAIYNFKKIKGFANFVQDGTVVLEHTISDFFSANVKVKTNPLKPYLSDFKIDISTNPNRNVYIVNDDLVVLVSKIMLNTDIYVLGVSIEGRKISTIHNRKVFNVLADSISNVLVESNMTSFRSVVMLFNENLIQRLISKYVATGAYNSYKIYYLIDLFDKLRSTTSEGKYFSTGLIATKALRDYTKGRKLPRPGVMLPLYSRKKIYDKIDTRYWYLADGYSSFYASDLRNDIHYMFVRYDNDKDYLSNVLLKNVLHGSDVLFRVDKGRELSIITADGIEFINQENVWRFRDYNFLKQLVDTVMTIPMDVYQSILYYVLYCSRNDTSSIIWIPNDITKIKDIVDSPHTVAQKTFNITDAKYDKLIKRLISSDGATIISKNGEVKYFNSFIKAVSGNKDSYGGTGEAAASKLSSNGIAFKISQDGTIKAYLGTKIKLKF